MTLLTSARRRRTTTRLLALATMVAGCHREPAPDPNERLANSASVPSPRAVSSGARVESDRRRELTRRCDTICDKSRQLKCKNADECQSNCLGMGSLRPCLEPVAAFYACLVKHPVEHWECAEDGVAAIRPGYCDPEQEHAVTCMEHNLTQ